MTPLTVSFPKYWIDYLLESKSYQDKKNDFKKTILLDSNIRRYTPGYYLADVLTRLYNKDGVHVDYGIKHKPLSDLEPGTSKSNNALRIVHIPIDSKVNQRLERDARSSMRSISKQVKYVLSKEFVKASK